ncbi:phospholipase D family protein [Alcanivorax sp. JB21]|uniref:phospholipase D-like domain-containing protein n=1 Tax=Alcanivorax limicola TaxID=2874102 RepID=UPI001CBFEF30|nr:phospholipase D family protein [Alcanivorax limicola]MBZ2189824.1 phospholipase D family protein [Alcanivorax limicola]
MQLSRRMLSAILALMVTAALSACGVTPVDRAAMDVSVAQRQNAQLDCPEAHPQRCAPTSGLAGLVDDSGDTQHVITLSRGSDALAARLHMIRTARSHILLQNYIFSDDEAGMLLLAELVAAARRGVQVHVLVDALLSLPDPALQASLELAHEGFALRLYNPMREHAMVRGGDAIAALTCCFRRFNHRMHNKLFAVDGRHVILGGRNTAARYFDLDTRMNFIDFEILVSGHVVEEVERGFFRYWHHELTRSPRHTVDVAAALDADVAPLSVIPATRLNFALAQAMDERWLDALIRDAGFRVSDVTYFNDPPDKIHVAPQDLAEDSTGQLRALMADARHSVTLQSPYLVMSRDFERFLRQRDPAVRWRISTNSLAATDAFPVYAISRRQRQRMVARHGLEIHEIRPFPEDMTDWVPRYDALIEEKAMGLSSLMAGDPQSPVREMPGPRVSVHAKVLVIDEEIAVITSHNFDPRSEVYNTENGLIIRDGAFAAAMTALLEQMMRDENSWLHAEKPRGIPVLGSINRTLARGSRRMPTLDVWPAHMTQNYSLRAGADPVPPLHPAFHERYEPEGEFPEVVLGKRRRHTAIISRMFGFLRPLM